MNTIRLIVIGLMWAMVASIAGADMPITADAQEEESLKTAFDLGFDAGLIPVWGMFFLAEALWTKRPHFDLLVSSAGFALGTAVYFVQYRLVKPHFGFRGALSTSSVLTALGLLSYQWKLSKLH